jgi:hypothetical protein
MMNHDEVFDLLAPLSLDALDADVTTQMEAHVAACLRCQSELDGFLEVATALGTTVEPLPDGLWSNIASRLNERPRAAVREAPLLGRSVQGGVIIPILAAKSTVSRRMKSVYGGVLTAAAASILALGIGFASANSHVGQLQGALNVANNGAVLSALHAPNHRIVIVSSPQLARIAEFVMLPDGRGYLVSSRVPRLASTLTYQLWGIVKGVPVSISVMGNAPSRTTFTMAGSPPPSALAITIQPAGGSVLPSKNLVGSGAV